ncbi:MULTISPECIES: DUF7547 family protein [Halolamina]|uniref:Uncharacterized protein n=1 Tax=Halolamina pelagica TaxID=699431 RepID=A0A1I5P0C9_9EURY|nr:MULTISPECIES: hypothetical protein [Halolamina]NHX36567.1 hypothetical protein [Halolamina sp. R1-12]SFP27499.1 hypothetical protein SAMN05216277_102285 [Halolamina pelagica]
MTDRRDPDSEELRELLADLESTLVDLRSEVDDDRRDVPRIPRGLPGGGRPAPRPPRLREVLRFTEEYTIPTLVSILEANIRLLQLGGAALRALDPERSAVPGGVEGDGAVSRALDAGRGLSADRLANSLDELNDALAGTEAPDPEARELLAEAESLSAEIQDRLREAGDRVDGARPERAAEQPDDAVHIDGADASGDDRREADTTDESAESPGPDVDAELDSIREEVRGADEGNGGESEGDDDADGTAPE